MCYKPVPGAFLPTVGPGLNPTVKGFARSGDRDARGHPVIHKARVGLIDAKENRDFLRSWWIIVWILSFVKLLCDYFSACIGQASVESLFVKVYSL